MRAESSKLHFIALMMAPWEIHEPQRIDWSTGDG